MYIFVIQRQVKKKYFENTKAIEFSAAFIFIVNYFILFNLPASGL
jgi:hypothetical protein